MNANREGNGTPGAINKYQYYVRVPTYVVKMQVLCMHKLYVPQADTVVRLFSLLRPLLIHPACEWPPLHGMLLCPSPNGVEMTSSSGKGGGRREENESGATLLHGTESFPLEAVVVCQLEDFHHIQSTETLQVEGEAASSEKEPVASNQN